MSLLSSVKDVVVGQAMKLAGDPRVTKVMTDPRLMNAAMKAMSLGGSIKSTLDQAGKLAGGMFGLATHEEISNLRSTIQDLEDQIAVLETRAAAAEAEAAAVRAEDDGNGAAKAAGKKPRSKAGPQP